MHTFQVIQILTELEEPWLQNPEQEVRLRLRKAGLRSHLKDAGVSGTLLTNEAPGWFLTTLFRSTEKSFHGVILEMAPLVLMAEGIDWLWREGFFHQQQNRKSQYLNRLLQTALSQGIHQERAKKALDLVYRYGHVHDSLRKIAGESPHVVALRSQLWEASFGASLKQALEGEEVLRERHVLIQGETGVGKELAAQAILASLPGIWKQSSTGPDCWSWQPPPQEAFNLAAIVPDLVSTEITGAMKGSYTGAANDRDGVLRRNHGGGVFLDEVGDLSMQAQVTLLRALETGKVLPLGGSETMEARCRVVSATHQELSRSRFRQDLYYRLTGVVLHVPPLRERKNDLPQITKQLMEQWNEQSNTADPERERMPTNYSNDRIEALQEWSISEQVQSYPWPGNVREFRRALATKVLGCEWVPPILSSGGVAHSSVAIPEARKTSQELTPKACSPLSTILSGEASLLEVQQWYTNKVLKDCEQNKSEAARRLKISRSRVRNLMSQPESLS